ncbi:POK8 protein, partial [Scopus umbretta]|nr:POK8 protein [Scopus umbretta]
QPCAVLDIKNCFFSIPLHPNDREQFAFTLPATNHDRPQERYHWKVLPQGMVNSPTMCQVAVAQTLKPVRQRRPEALIYQYMDDILISGQNQQTTLETLAEVQ